MEITFGRPKRTRSFTKRIRASAFFNTFDHMFLMLT